MVSRPSVGIVEDEQLGVDGHRQGQVELRPHAGGEFLDLAVQRQTEGLHQTAEEFLVPVQGQSLAQADEPPDPVALDQMMSLRDIPDAAVRLRGQPHRILPQHDGAAARRRLQAQQDADDRGLAGAVAAEQPIDASARHSQADPVQDAPALVVLDQVLNDDWVVIHNRIGLHQSATYLNSRRPSRTIPAAP